MRAFKYCGLFLILALAACQQTPPAGMKLGKPYSVDGETYYPEYNSAYDETGEASWYGPGFHGKYTACGEVFNQNDLTAAHPTLPMPSLVRVTNLSNGRSLIVRINDRGPFKSHRIIDLSKAAARRLGIASIARVRVQFLKKETEEYVASLDQGGKRVIDMAQYNRDHADTQIVENLDSSSHADQIIEEAAPVMTVSSTELESPAGSTPKHSASLIKAAWAGDTQSKSNKENDAPGFDPPLSKPDTSPHTIPSEVHNDHPSVLTYDAPGSAYIVQAGSFTEEGNARKLASRLSKMATVDRIDVGSKSWWRVRLGPFKTKKSADEALATVRAVGVTDAKIIHL